jgi:hypothetical protein
MQAQVSPVRGYGGGRNMQTQVQWRPKLFHSTEEQVDELIVLGQRVPCDQQSPKQAEVEVEVQDEDQRQVHRQAAQGSCSAEGFLSPPTKIGQEKVCSKVGCWQGLQRHEVQVT